MRNETEGRKHTPVSTNWETERGPKCDVSAERARGDKYRRKGGGGKYHLSKDAACGQFVPSAVGRRGGGGGLVYRSIRDESRLWMAGSTQ